MTFNSTTDNNALGNLTTAPQGMVPPSVHRNRLHKCSECGYDTNRLSNYKRHCDSHQRLGTPRSCCDILFPTRHDLKKHKRDAHEKGEYRCPRDNCTMVFAQKSNLKAPPGISRQSEATRLPGLSL
ncbi:hypothetical protein MTO96_027959 [Rhipicephalus appendiculatus]